MSDTSKPVKNIQSVHRALDILELLVDNGYGLKLNEISTKCGLNKTTTFHLLKTLENRGYVEQSYDTQLYKMGWKLLETGYSTSQNSDIHPVADPYLARITALTGETTTLYYFMRVEDYYMAVTLMQRETEQPLKFTAPKGSRIPLHCTAAGKVRLLGYSPEMLDDQLAKMPLDSYTPATVTDPEIIKQQLTEIRKKGYCIAREEYLPGICSVAVPMYKYTGRVSYAVSVSVPSPRATDEYLDFIAKTMMEVLSTPSNYPDFQFKGAPL